MGDKSSRGHAESTTGRRANNEDSFYVNPGLGLYVVADGMGGHEGGEVASRLVVDTVGNFFERASDDPSVGVSGDEHTVAESRMDMAIRMAHREVARQAEGELASMGSTLAAVLLKNDRALIAHVGDSRVYRIRGGAVEQLTRDHSLTSDLESAGCTNIMANLPVHYRHMITRSISAHANAEPDLRIEDTQSGDVFVICSDGLTDVMTGEDIADVASEHEPELASQLLLDKAYAAGSLDNITAVVVKVE